MKAGKNCLKGSSTYVTKYTCTWLRNSTVGSEKVQLNSCLQIVQLYFLALTGIRSKITGIQEISWSEKSTADLRLCLEWDVMILEMSGKKSTLVLKFLRLAFFVSCVILNTLKLSKATFQPHFFSVLSLFAVLVKIRSIGVQRKNEKKKGVFVQMWSQEKSQYQSHCRFAGGFAMLF